MTRTGIRCDGRALCSYGFCLEPVKRKQEGSPETVPRTSTGSLGEKPTV